MGCNYTVTGSIGTTVTLKAVFNARITIPNVTDRRAKVTQLLKNRKDFKGTIGLSLQSPSEYDISSTLIRWKNDGMIYKYDYTRFGYLIIFVNDGDDAVKNDKAAYEDSCTRLSPPNPVALSRLADVSIKSLRLLAQGKHFVDGTNGLLYEAPAGSKLYGPKWKAVISDHGAAHDTEEGAQNRKWTALAATLGLDGTSIFDATHLRLSD